MKKDELISLYKRIINYKYIELIFTIAYTTLLYFAYLIFIQDNVNIYYKTDFNIEKFFISIVGIILIYLFNSKVKNRHVRFFMTLFYYLMFIPISVVYCGKDYNNIIYFCIMLQFILIYLTVGVLEKIFNKNENKNEKIDKKEKVKKIMSSIIYILFIINTIITLGACIYYNGLPRSESNQFIRSVRSERTILFTKIF